MKQLKLNWFVLFWIAALLVVMYMFYEYRTPKKYIGIVETKSHLIGAQEPGTIRNVLVSVGEQITRGQILVTLDISDLETEVAQLREELAAIQQLGEAHQDRYEMEFQRLHLQLENEMSDLTEQLATLGSKRTELSILDAEIDRLTKAEEAGLGRSRDLTDLMVQRETIASYLKEHGEAYVLQQQQLEKTRYTRDVLDEADRDGIVRTMLLDPMERAEELRREITGIEHRMHLRTLLAPCDGYVVEMFAHEGDIVQDFTPILSVEESESRYLTIYIPEKANLQLAVGIQTKIYSPRLKRYTVPGIITFIHPGLSQTPERLAFRRQIFWARRVRVELGQESGLLPGEIVYCRING